VERDELLKDLTILDFMAVDLGLFLNTHENDREALLTYNSIIERADRVRQTYEKMYGPLCSFRSYGGDYWRWPEEPWPWEEEFNFEFSGGGEER